MISLGRPTFEIVTPATVEDRRLVSVDTIRTLTGLPETGAGAITDDALGLLIDAELARMAKSCRLATSRATAPTLALEEVRATWLPATMRASDWVPSSSWSSEPSQILLPWRAPIVSIEVSEGETELVEYTDFRLLDGGILERVGACWGAGGAIVVDYSAGWMPMVDYPDTQEGEPMPADLVALLGDQVRMAADRRDIDLNLRSEDVPDVWSGTYNVAGGSAVDTGGLMRPLYDALDPYRKPPSFA